MGKQTWRRSHLQHLLTLLPSEITRLPATDKMKVLGVLGYLILPADVLPDITPIVGFSDDLAAIVFLLKNLSKYTTSEIKEKARERAKNCFTR